jgi:S-adenosylmethionine hydrolase
MIALFTDFGLCGPYTGQMQAVLQQAAPQVPAIQLVADAPAGDPRASSYLLATCAAWFPADTIFLCVVDPGVGGTRKALIVETGEHRFVGPDNGLFEQVLRRATRVQAWEITWRPPRLSASFHGRDLFAPVAAKLACGDAIESLGVPVEPLRHPDWPSELPEIVYIDHYGNAMTGLRTLPETARLDAGGQQIPHAATFSAVPQGGLFWYVNSNGLIEIAANRTRADRLLNLAVGSAVAVL